ncbi:hypothetical protein [Streptomyces sp. NPDC056661]|uniref:hypothetical protein n=1 Tax=Streptomyces sp. NPDC056661 TaxID=3345898 RepID=UPI0036B71DE3
MDETDLIYGEVREVRLGSRPFLDDLARQQLIALARSWSGRDAATAEDFFTFWVVGTGSVVERVSVLVSRVAAKDEPGKGTSPATGPDSATVRWPCTLEPGFRIHDAWECVWR